MEGLGAEALISLYIMFNPPVLEYWLAPGLLCANLIKRKLILMYALYKIHICHVLKDLDD